MKGFLIYLLDNFNIEGKIHKVQTDISNFDSVEQSTNQTIKLCGQIDILVNNTQGPKAGDVNSLSIEDYQNAFDLLFKNIVFTTMLALEKMKKNKWGRIINMTSISVKEPLSY